MPDAKHTPPGDTSFATSVARHAGAAVALVAVVAAAFWGVGTIRSDASDAGTNVSVDAGPSEPAAPGDTASPDTSTTDNATEPAATATSTTSTEASPSEDASAGEIPPGEISIQVLDAVHDPGAVTAHRIADRLKADGYDVLVVNPAGKLYGTTTVMYTPGHEDAARQIAKAYGFAKVTAAVSNLSNSVDVHLVVGSDEAN